MDAITLSTEIGEDHRLVIQLPDNVPPGPVEVTIKIGTGHDRTATNLAQDAARAKLLAAGKLSLVYVLPSDFTRPSDEELLKLVVLPAGSPSIDKIIDEDRGPH